MIRTLRITMIVTAIVAGLFFILSAMFGLRRDKDKEAFLDNPGITTAIKKGTASRENSEQDVPLVKQAQAFALRINPPKPVEAQVSTAIQKPVIAPPAFKLLGTSYYPSDPNRSMALIDEPGKGMHWIVISDKVGYLIITNIVDGKIDYTDGKKNMEMFVEKPQTPQQISVISVNGAAVSSPTGAPGQGAGTVPVSPSPAVIASTPEQVKENAEFIKKLMADSNAAGVDPAEANELKGLGEFLKQLEKEQAAAEANAPKEEPNVPRTNSNERHSE